MRQPKLLVESGTVEPGLAHMLRFEFADLQVDGRRTAHPGSLAPKTGTRGPEDDRPLQPLIPVRTTPVLQTPTQRGVKGFDIGEPICR